MTPDPAHRVLNAGWFFFRERREDEVFKKLLKLCSGLEDQLVDGSSDDVASIADLVSNGFKVACICVELQMTVAEASQRGPWIPG